VSRQLQNPSDIFNAAATSLPLSRQGRTYKTKAKEQNSDGGNPFSIHLPDCNRHDSIITPPPSPILATLTL